MPAPGEAALPAASVGALLERNASEVGGRPFVRFDQVTWTHATYLDESRRWGNVLASLRPDEGPFHVGVLMQNVPDYLAILGGAALVGATVVGLNPTRQGEQLVRDARHTDVGIVVAQSATAPLAEPLVDGLDAPVGRYLTVTRWDASGDVLGTPAEEALDDAGMTLIDRDVDIATPWCLIFTSGTTSDPKAVICSQRRMLQTGERMRLLLGVEPDDVGYISMPLFHSNSLMVGFMPALVAGAAVGLARRFTASRFLDDVRRYGATWFNYTGKPLSYILATVERPDDADNPLCRALGNEGSPEAVARFAERFGVEVTDLFGPTEGAIGLVPDEDTPRGALGRATHDIRVVDDDGNDLTRARLDETGRLLNPEECVGEIVNTAGGGPFEGYYGSDDATAAATRFGWYWTGDLGYIDADGFLYFAGRADDWVRVDGENFPTGPVEQAIGRHPDVVVVAAYGVPDAEAGDQLMVALVLRDDATFDPGAFAAWLDGQPDLPPKWRPRYLRLARELPQTATTKVITRILKTQKWRSDLVGDDEVWIRERGADAFRPFTTADEGDLRVALEQHGRDRFWEL
ncbi:MAG: AMP-binding protein [Actinobacteria bacterium]|nr:AMP-binding protein [Actinomycetota bacterium]